ncbi:MAG: hypothetical protein J6W11_02210 [Alphaproteobacteria bacterium]|nr:hypothetical protein [Alphaproteobacteria bacterium]
MKKHLRFILAVIITTVCCLMSSFSEAQTFSERKLAIGNKENGTYVAHYNKQLSKSEKAAICSRLQNTAQSYTTEDASLGGGIIPDDVLVSIFNTTRNISDSLKLVSSLGDALMCHAVHAAKHHVKIMGVEIMAYPDIPVWLCGAIIYCFGFMFVLSVTFYVVDISFKLGFAIILLPIGIALWPFEKTKDKLPILISIFLKTAAIFAFLAITVSYTVAMLSQALGSEGMTPIYEAITKNDTDFIGETFAIGSGIFLILLAVLIYGMKLIGSTIPNYVDKFFPDKAFGSSSPMHHLATQAMDFAKKKAIAPAADFAKDVAATQLGKATEKTGQFLQGGYKNTINNIGRAVRNPRQVTEKMRLNLEYGKKIALANFQLGKQNRQDAKQNLRDERDQKKQSLDTHIDQLEQQRADEKQHQHEQRMQNDPAYRARMERRQERTDHINKIDQKLADIDKNMNSHLLDKNKAFDSIESFAEKLKNNPLARASDAVHAHKQQRFNQIDHGKFANKEGDGAVKRTFNAVMRGGQKAFASAVHGVAQVPLSVASNTTNLLINTASTVAQVGAAIPMSVSNGVVRAVYGAQKIVPNLQKAYYKPASLVKGAVNATGKVMEQTGQAMQDHRPEEK